MTILFLLVIMIPSQAKEPWRKNWHRNWEYRYKENLNYHYTHVYRKYYNQTSWIKGNDHVYLVSGHNTWKGKERDAYIKKLKGIKIYKEKAPWTEYHRARLSKKYKQIFINQRDIKSLTPHISFDDDPGSTLVRMAHSKGTWYITQGSYSVGHQEVFPKEWRIWTKPIDIDDKFMPYCGMVDDDLMYDFTKENPFKTIQTQNQDSPFLYVYDFPTYRKRSADWVLHDRFIHGCRSHGDEEDKNPARITFGPVLKSANHKIVRALRVHAFIRLYLAKLRIAKLLHPAPEWIEANGDYTDKPYSYRTGGNDRTRKWDKLLSPEYNARNNTPRSEYIKAIISAPNEHYFRILGRKICIPTEAVDALKVKDWKKAKLWAKIAQYFELYRDFYIYKMFVRSDIQKEHDFGHYCNREGLSIALWSGMSAYSRHRHQFIAGLKYFYPFFERTDKLGNVFIKDMYERFPRYAHTSNTKKSVRYRRSRWDSYQKILTAKEKYTSGPMNTAGIIYAGQLTMVELGKYMNAMNMTTKQAWKCALKGPFMIVSSRTYKRYGHKYFEKLAKHSLKKVDVTGAVIESASRIQLAPDVDQIKQLIDMDYFYYKNNASDVRGTKTMKKASEIKITKNPVVMRGSYDPVRAARNPVTHALKRLNRKIHSSTNLIPNIHVYDYVARDIQRALAKDNREYPGMSIRMANYYPYFKNEPLCYSRISRVKSVLYLDQPNRGRALFMKNIKRLMNQKPPGMSGYGLKIILRGVVHKGSDARFMKKYFRRRTPRNIDFLLQVKEMKAKRVVEKLRRRYGRGNKFMYQLQLAIAEQIPWLCFNPHMFLAYYKHSAKLWNIYKAAFFGINEMGNGTSDGTMIWKSQMTLQGGPGLTVAYTAREYIRDSISMRMLWCLGYASVGRYNVMAPAGGYRKSHRKHHFPWYESESSHSMGTGMFTDFHYSDLYMWVRNNEGGDMLLRDPSWAILQGYRSGRARAELYSKLFPGMIRYVNRDMLVASQAYYAEIPHSNSYIKYSPWPGLRASVDSRKYVTPTGLHLMVKAARYNGESNRKLYLAGMKETRAKIDIYPTESCTFVVTDGIRTTVMGRKDSLAFGKRNSNLYEGMGEL